jgi:tungstate transport system substrate-binding protein
LTAVKKASRLAAAGRALGFRASGIPPGRALDSEKAIRRDRKEPAMTPLRRGLAAAILGAASLLLGIVPPVLAEDRPFITVASTTSTQDSGLFEDLLPAFARKTGIEVHVVAVGTGQAMMIGERGDADVLLVHDKPSELKFVAAGHGVDRREVMYNDFILIGPKADPAGVAGGNDIVAAFRKIAAGKADFASRADDSGTDKAEKRLWQDAGIAVKEASGTWYKETGSGMGPTLNTAAAMGAYALADRGTWLSFKNRRELTIVVEGDRRLFNQYGVILVNPAKYKHVKATLGEAFIAWLTSPEGQQTIAGYKVNGEQLFFPDYAKPAS